MLRAFPTAVIENLQPLVDGGRYMVKRVVGDDLAVEADVFKDGHDVVAAALKWRKLGETLWHETPMAHVDNDRWRGVCTLYENAIYEYTVEAWTDTFRGKLFRYDPAPTEISLLSLRRGRMPPNHALRRTRPLRSGCNRAPSRAGSLSLGRLGSSVCFRTLRRRKHENRSNSTHEY